MTHQDPSAEEKGIVLETIEEVRRSLIRGCLTESQIGSVVVTNWMIDRVCLYNAREQTHQGAQGKRLFVMLHVSSLPTERLGRVSGPIQLEENAEYLFGDVVVERLGEIRIRGGNRPRRSRLFFGACNQYERTEIPICMRWKYHPASGNINRIRPGFNDYRNPGCILALIVDHLYGDAVHLQCHVGCGFLDDHLCISPPQTLLGCQIQQIHESQFALEEFLNFGPHG